MSYIHKEYSTPIVVIYVDGACEPNPGKGGWGVYIASYDPPESWSGPEPDTTSNRMELMAAIKALEMIPEASHVQINSDSEYVVKGMTEWIEDWKAKGWKNSSKKPVANRDLWERLDQAAQNHTVEWSWVKGHSGIEGNEIADALAHAACKRG